MNDFSKFEYIRQSMPPPKRPVCKYEEAMKLPKDKTCKDCVWFDRCKSLGCTWADRTSCDFYPSKFVGELNEHNRKSN